MYVGSIPTASTRIPNMNKEFNAAHLTMRKDSLEWLAWCGEPNLYDYDLYVLREPIQSRALFLKWFLTPRIV